jgi:2-polyprenyl-6-hydroxyphenyl methylase/3-demethylubiquinone-9 3-methyltransferase
MPTPPATDVDQDRFGFGENWSRFAAELPPERIEAAKASLAQMLERDSLDGLTFLDIGSGSGLFSLAASQLGAERVHSLDYDPDSVATTASLRERFAPDAAWGVERASALDAEHMQGLGTWDVVYSWGVLHHTGDMWTAIANAVERVAPGGQLFISIYNDQGGTSRVWTQIKRRYNRLPAPLRTPYAVAVMAPSELASLGRLTLRGRPGEYFRGWRDRGDDGRGMSRWHDLIDWVGGYPFEVATPEAIIDFCLARGFKLRRLHTVGGGLGCNEFVFELPEVSS